MSSMRIYERKKIFSNQGTQRIAPKSEGGAEWVTRFKLWLDEYLVNEGICKKGLDEKRRIPAVNPKVRKEIVRKLIECSVADFRELGTPQFKIAGLSGLLDHYENSAYTALVDLNLAHGLAEVVEHAKENRFDSSKIYPWEMRHAPKIYCYEDMRIALTTWVIWKLKEKRDWEHITRTDFMKLGLRGLLSNIKNSTSCMWLFVEAGYVYGREQTLEHSEQNAFQNEKKYMWEYCQLPDNFWDDQAIRIAAVRWFFWKTNDRNPSYRSFLRLRLAKILAYYERSAKSAYDDAHIMFEKEEDREE